MDYAAELKKLLEQYPNLKLEAHRIFFKSTINLDNSAHLDSSTNSYERIYKAVKAIADKQSIKV